MKQSTFIKLVIKAVKQRIADAEAAAAAGTPNDIMQDLAHIAAAGGYLCFHANAIAVNLIRKNPKLTAHYTFLRFNLKQAVLEMLHPHTTADTHYMYIAKCVNPTYMQVANHRLSILATILQQTIDLESKE